MLHIWITKTSKSKRTDFALSSLSYVQLLHYITLRLYKSHHCAVYLFSTGATSVSPCVNQYFEVKEGETTNRLTCRGLTSQDTVSWFAKGTAAGSCPPLPAGSSPDSCTPAPGAYGEVFRPSRTANAVSVLNVDPVVHNSTAVERGGSLECRIASGTKPTASCQMDYVCELDMILLECFSDTVII